MVRRFRKPTTFVTLILLLAAQSLPALDICVCEVPLGEACCQRAAEPVAEPGCCSTQQPVSTNIQLAANDVPSLTPEACQRQSVTAETSIAALPTAWETKTTTSQVGVLSIPVIDHLSFDSRLPLHTLRAPGAHAPPLFLLNASFRA